MTKNEIPVIAPVDDVLVSAEELVEKRWHGMHPRIAAQKLREYGCPAIRLGSRTIKYRLSEIVKIENEAASRTMDFFRKKKKEAAAKPEVVQSPAKRAKIAKEAASHV